MPPPPEIVEGAGLKGGLEVFDQVVPQDTRRAQGDITAAGEIHVQLHGEQHGGGNEIRAAHAGNITVDQRDILAQVVGNDHFFCVAPQHTKCAACAAAIAEPAALLNLRPHLGVTLDGAVDERGEEADEQRIVQRVRFDPATALEHIDGVAHGRKGEVAEAQGGQQILPVGEEAAAQRIRQQVPVFVVNQNTDAEPYRDQ